MSDKKDSSFGMGSFIAGAAVGALLGVLFAPDKGSETRRKISDKLEEYKDKMHALLAEMAAMKEQGITPAADEGRKTAEVIAEIEMLIQKIKAAEKTNS